jgi:predicted metal-dependent hydrolase
MLEIFQQAHSELHPGTAMLPLAIEFFPFAGLNNTIRLRHGRLQVRLSDVLEGAPQPVLRALAHVLLAKLYRKPVDPKQIARFHRHARSREIQHKTHLARQLRGRKQLGSARGAVYDLAELFRDLNRRFFAGLLAEPRLSWSRGHARSRLAHFDPAHNTIVVSRIFDQPAVPRYALEYIVFHEMLHLRHPVRVRGRQRLIHSAEFRAEERQFPRREAARRFLRALTCHGDPEHIPV